MTQIAERQKLEQDPIIEILVIEKDTAKITITNIQNVGLSWNGVSLIPVEFIAEGFETRADNESPRPTVKMFLADPVILSFLKNNDMGRGGTVTRYRTYLKFLDGQSEADSTQVFGKEIYKINKAKRTFPLIEWELRSLLELPQNEFPMLRLNRSYCDLVYRSWNGTAYVPHTCPYSGTAKFTSENVSTTDPILDVCCKNITACRLRYGNNPLPFRGTVGQRR